VAKALIHLSLLVRVANLLTSTQLDAMSSNSQRLKVISATAATAATALLKHLKAKENTQ
jgi:hypothetical protein